MSTRDAHIVRLQRLDVTLNGSEFDGFALQNRLSLLCNDWLLPALDRALERCAPAEGHWYLEHLEIDAGNIALDRLEQDFPDAVAHAVEAALREKTAAAPANSTAPKEQTAVFKSRQQATWEAFLYFLETGRLPWTYRLPAGESMETAVRQIWADDATSKAGSARFGTDLIEKLSMPVVRQRMVQQFQPAFLSTVIARMVPEMERAVAQILTELRPDLPQDAFAFFEKTLLETALASAVGAATHRTPQPIPAVLAEGTHSERLLRLLSETWSRIEHLKPAVTAALRGAAQGRKATLLSTAILQMQVKTALSGTSAPSAPQPDTATQPNPSRSEMEGLYLDHAGLVLLHPFLPQFFTALGVADGAAWTQPDRAPHLLHFLATGKTGAPEYEMVFAKFLCGIPLEQSLEADIQLTDQEQEEAQNLLETVVRYWDALQGASPDGLREAFLQRPGKLSRRDDSDWLLQIEKKSHDILLDQLPWGIARIQLPWMPAMLHVEWQ